MPFLRSSASHLGLPKVIDELQVFDLKIIRLRCEELRG